MRTNVSWEEFEAFVRSKNDKAVPRVTYLDGELELVTPSHGHERNLSWIGSLVIAYALERNIELSSIRSWLLKNKLRKAGAEPDDCFIVGDDASEENNKRPHFVIEVQWSRASIDKLEVYKRLDVPEVWFWERHNEISIYVLRDRAWRRVKRSPRLPRLNVTHLCSFLDRPSTTAAIRDYQTSLRAGRDRRKR